MSLVTHHRDEFTNNANFEVIINLENFNYVFINFILVFICNLF